MKTQKIKRYRLGVSCNFPTTHPRKKQATYFIEQICGDFPFELAESNRKIHTIRSNFELWPKRMLEVQAGRAVIELFYWSGKPYHKDENGIGQVVFATLDKSSGCGVQELSFINNELIRPCMFGNGYAARNKVEELSKNDGLSLEDFKAWFKGYDLSQPMAIIHFTSFRY